jgi:hypothetical protein
MISLRFLRTSACVPAIVFCFLNLAAGSAECQTATETAGTPKLDARPPVYALVSALGDKFSIVFAVQTIGSHVDPYRRRSGEVKDDALNRVVLADLDKAVKSIHPDSKLVYLELPPAEMSGVPAAEREQAAIGHVVEALRTMSERTEWDRIVVATPAYRSLEVDGMASKLEGFGVFVQPLCQSDVRACGHNFRSPNGAKAITPDGKPINANQFVASFSNVEIWVLDAKTLAVLDRERHFDNQKIANASARIPDMSDKANKDFLMTRVSSVIERSITEAFKSTELRGKVTVSEPRVVDPALAPK